MQGPGWDVVLPVKGGADAKSRLGLGARGPRLALAMAMDCLGAVLVSGGVRRALVVTGDADVVAEAAAAGAVVVPQPPEPGLDAALAAGTAACEGPAVVLLADLPCLTAADLDDALEAAARSLTAGARSVFVPDADDVGTVLLAAMVPAALRPAFGGASADRHEAGGAVRLALPLPRLRRDVDTVPALHEAIALGVGPRTAATLAACRPPS